MRAIRGVRLFFVLFSASLLFERFVTHFQQFLCSPHLFVCEYTSVLARSSLRNVDDSG